MQSVKILPLITIYLVSKDFNISHVSSYNVLRGKLIFSKSIKMTTLTILRLSHELSFSAEELLNSEGSQRVRTTSKRVSVSRVD